MSQQPTEVCDNCLKPFPQSKIATHFGYCRRNIKKCPNCGEMYDINFQQQHEEEFHKMASCKYCQKQFKPAEVAKHESKCDSKTQYCQYCDLDVPMKDYPSHLRECQARTKQCDKCRKPIANKDFLIHTISCPGFVEQTKPSITSNTNKYSNYEAYLKEQQHKKQEIKRNEYKPAYEQPRRQISRGQQVRPEQGYGNNMYANNNGLRQAEIKKQAIIPNKPSSQSKGPNYADINMNKHAINFGDKKVVPPTNAMQRDRGLKVQPNSNKHIDSGKNIGSGKAIQHKYGSSTRPANEYQPSINPYGIRKEVPTKVITSTNNPRTYQPPQIDVNTRPAQQIPSKNYPKVQENFRKQIPSSKDVYPRRQEKPKQPSYADYQYKKEDPRKYQQPIRTMPKTNTIPTQQYRPQQQARQYVPSPQEPTYQHDTGVNDHEMDEELQKAIMASLGNLQVSSPKNSVPKQSKPTYKIDDIPPQLLENDMMNESFYGKQQALWEEIQKNKKRR